MTNAVRTREVGHGPAEPIGESAPIAPRRSGAEPSPGREQDGRVGPLRAAALRSATLFLVAAVYVAGTWSQPDRPAMAAVTAAGFAVAVGAHALAPRTARSRFRQPWGAAAVGVHLACCLALAQLDGGIASPVGALAYFTLPFLATTVPPRWLAGFIVATVAGYLGVGASTWTAPPGYGFTFTAGFVAVSLLCAKQAALVRSIRRRLLRVSRVDPLTGCLNRRGFEEQLLQELSRADRTGRPLTVVLLDLDSFKSVNDTHGHRTGDRLLAWTGATLLAESRPHDVVSRIGGDEFAVVLTDTSAADAGPAAERLRAALAENAPASIGWASYPLEASTPGDLLALGDRRAYDDKARPDRRRPDPTRLLHDVVGPTAEAEAAPTTVERRRTLVYQAMAMSLTDFVIGLAHALLFTRSEPHHDLTVALLGTGLALGLATLAATGGLARLPRVGPVVLGVALMQYGLAIAATTVAGGVGAPIAMGLLVPLPLIALGTPLALAAPTVVVASTVYVAQAVLVGTPSAWYAGLHLFGILAVSVGCALQYRDHTRQRRLLGTLSRADALTGCLNRRGFEQRFDAEVVRARAEGTDLSLLVLDLDGFKRLNDTEGHAAGDALLCWVAATLGDLLRGHDVVGRLGGDEFHVLLANCPADRAPQIAGRVRERLAARVPASIGVATLGRDGDDFDALYRHADAGLYAEKAARREGGVSRPR